ncbi:MAG: SBBP repeat-containing protein [Bacteroidales bacterium]
MKKSLLLILFVLSCSFSTAQYFEWAGAFSGAERQEGRAIDVDAAGNVYITGSYKGESDFDPGPGTFSLTPVGNYEIFLTKLDMDGNLVWALSFGDSDLDEGRDLCLDAEGNIYLTGYFTGTVDFDPGPGVVNLNSPGSGDIFILKLDPSGNFMKVLQMGGPDYTDSPNSIAVDSSGNIYTTGSFKTAADFDPGPGVYTLEGIGLADIFISKLDSAGNFLWAKEIGSTQDDSGWEVSIDFAGNVVAIGGFRATADFDPGPDTLNFTSFGQLDSYILKLNPDGELIWADQVGGTNGDNGYTMVLDQIGNVFLGGSFQGSCDFNPGPDTTSLVSSYDIDAFAGCYNPDGDLVWVKQIAGSRREAVMDIDSDPAGSLYMTGMYTGSVDFDPGPGVFTLTTADYFWDIFILKLDYEGNFLWAKETGGGNLDQGNAIAADIEGNSYTTGYFMETSDFDPGTGVYYITGAGDFDCFVLKLTPYAVGLDAEKNLDNLTVYPNPVNGNFTLNIPEVLNGSEFNVTDQTGRIVTKGKLTSTMMQFDLSGLVPGLYFLRVADRIPMKVLLLSE